MSDLPTGTRVRYPRPGYAHLRGCVDAWELAEDGRPGCWLRWETAQGERLGPRERATLQAFVLVEELEPEVTL